MSSNRRFRNPSHESNRKLEDLYDMSLLRHPSGRQAAKWNEKRIHQQQVRANSRQASDRNKRKLYAFGWLIFSLLGLYGYFSSPQRDGALNLFLSDPGAAIQKYFIGNPAQSLAAFLMWVAAYQTGAVMVFPEERKRHTFNAFALVAVSLAIFQIAG